MLQSYLPVLVFAGLGIIVGGAFALLNAVIGPKRPNPIKGQPYECGLPSHITRTFRFGVSFYMIAMLFILFDIEVVFLYPVGVLVHATEERLRPGGDPRLRRAVARRPGLRLASRGARLEVERRASEPASCAPATCCAEISRAATSRSTSRSGC